MASLPPPELPTRAPHQTMAQRWTGLRGDSAPFVFAGGLVVIAAVIISFVINLVS